MDREKAKQILESWLLRSKGTEERIGYVEGWFFKEDEEAFDMAIEALTVSEDCISRKQAIEEMSEALIVLFYDYNMEQDELVDTIEEQVRACAQQILKSLPSVTPTERIE